MAAIQRTGSTLGGSRLVSWNPAIITIPVQQAAKVAFAETLAYTKGIAPKGASAAMTRPRKLTSGVTMYLAARGWGTILAAGAKPHDIVASGLEGGGGSTTYTRASGRTRRRKSTGKGARALAAKGFGPVASVHHPGIHANPYIEKGAAVFPTAFGRALASRLGRRIL